jgi:molybdopterin-containing oxidoreductase family iron-sulfur binding subunit
MSPIDHVDRALWRSREERAAGPMDPAAPRREFDFPAAEWDPIARRDFLRLMGASFALAGLTACTRQPPEKIVPYVQPPEEVIPGRPLFYATAMPLGGYGLGLLAESHVGRPIKVEGNPQHPSSLGGTDCFAQASVLDLYDPDRSQIVKHLGRPSGWDAFTAAMVGELEKHRATQGARFRILTGTVTSPTLASQLGDLFSLFPLARWHSYEPVGRDHALEGAKRAFGEYVESVYHFAQADVVVALDADVLGWGPGRVRYARDFAARRRVSAGFPAMNRLYAIETVPTITGAAADHRLALPPAAIEFFARKLAAALGVEAGVEPPKKPARWLDAVVQDLKQHRGTSLVIAGDSQPPVVHALAHAINEALDNPGRTVTYVEPVAAAPQDQARSLGELVRDMAGGHVDLLVVMGSNPVYSAPADLNFAEALNRVGTRVHLGLYEDETAVRCDWHLPEAHYLEAWSDVRAHDGTAGTVQPLIEPPYGGRSAHELAAVLGGGGGKTGLEIVKSHWRDRHPGGEFEAFWRRALHDGVIPGTAASPQRDGSPAAGRGRRRNAVRRRGMESRLPPRRLGVGWAVREQRAAAGIAPAPFQADVGRRGDDQSRHGIETRGVERRRRRTGRRRPRGERAGLDPARPRGRLRQRLARLRPRARGARRDGRGIQRVRAADGRRALVGLRPEGPARGGPARFRVRAGAPSDGRAQPPSPGVAVRIPGEPRVREGSRRAGRASVALPGS